MTDPGVLEHILLGQKNTFEISELFDVSSFLLRGSDTIRPARSLKRTKCVVMIAVMTNDGRSYIISFKTKLRYLFLKLEKSLHEVGE